MGRFRVEKIEDNQYGILDADNSLVDNHPYRAPGAAQDDCNELNEEAVFSVGDQVAPNVGLREGDTGTIEQEKISLYPAPTIQYIVRFDAPSRYSQLLSDVYRPEHLERR